MQLMNRTRGPAWRLRFHPRENGQSPDPLPTTYKNCGGLGPSNNRSEEYVYP